ncbi:hypothetical protein V8132_004410 [Vibrio parahaemolyticus]
MSSSKSKITKRKISNVKARRDVKNKRALKMQNFWSRSSLSADSVETLKVLLSKSELSSKKKNDLIELYEDLSALQVDYLKVRNHEDLGSINRIYDFSNALIQVYLHRVTNLFEGAVQSLYTKNVYLMALSIRGLFESTAALGFLFSRIDSFKNNNISSIDLDNALMTLLLGTKDKQLLLQEGSGAYEAKNVMKLLDYADKAFSSKVMDNKLPEKNMLRVSYEWLCEFCHPNFHSGALAFQLDKDNGVMKFNHQKSSLIARELVIIEQLFIPTFAFLSMHEKTKHLLSTLEANKA